MKKISVLIPCYNEEENVVPMSEAVADIFAKELPEYDYELVFIDNDSKDATRIHGSRQFLMPKTLDSSIRRIMESYRRQEIVRFPCAVTSRTRSS